MARKPLKATDKRRAGYSDNTKTKVSTKDHNGSAKALAGLFSDRRHPNGSGHRAS